MDSLISISVQTEVGISIYSSKIIKDSIFYIQTLKDSGINIVIEYGDRTEQLGIENVVSLFSFDNSIESISHFNKLYNEEFNSTIFKIFQMIEKAYIDKYGFSIYDSPVFLKYHELRRKIAITEKSLADMYKKFDLHSRSKIAHLHIGHIIDECNKYILDPFQNEAIIVKKLEYILNQYKKVASYQLMVGTGVCVVETKKEIDPESKKSMTIKKNKYGQFVYDKYNFVFDPINKSITGVSDGIGGVVPLNEENIRLCVKIGLKYMA